MPNLFSIADIERSTGISRETLRIWERRYGFPAPARDAGGDRRFSGGDLDRLRRIKRLLDQGHRPGKIVPMSVADLAELDLAMPDGGTAFVASRYDGFWEYMRQTQSHAAYDWLRGRLVEEGAAVFVQETLAPLIEAVGDAWAADQLQVHDEHLFSQWVQRLLHAAIGEMPGAAMRPYVLLTTLPEEQHSLGLLMAETLLTQDGARCLSLGVDTPLPEIVAAVQRHQVDVLALSFSLAYPRRRIAAQLAALRAALPPHCEIWAGGRATVRLRAIQGVRYCPKLEDAAKFMQQWKAGSQK